MLKPDRWSPPRGAPADISAMVPPPARPRGPDSPDRPTPVCRCRVLYLGSAVPHASKDGLQGIQGPLHELYPSDGLAGANGIDSWLSVWSNGLLLENVDEQRSKVTRFFPIESLHYCAAVRHVLVPGPGGVRNPVTHFMPLDAPFARAPNPIHPPLFTAILRRTSGLKVLECHVFMCRRETPANALVRCCFHVYADAMAAKQLDGALYDSIYGYTGQVQQWDESEAKLDVEERGDETSEGGATPTPPRATPTRQPDPRRAPINGVLPPTHPLSVDVGDGGMNGNIPGLSPGSQDANKSLYGTGKSRPLRPRQRVMPAAPPPPPPPETGTGRRRRQRDAEVSDRTRSASAAALSRPPPSPSPNGSPGWRGWDTANDRRSYSRAEVHNGRGEGRGSQSPQGRTLPARRPRQPGQPPQGYDPQYPSQRGPLPPAPTGYNLATMSLSRSRGPRELRAFVPQQPSYPAPEPQMPPQQYATLERPRSRRSPRDQDRLRPLHNTTGRKGHLNERAFGLSMQQEHRSRSQGSLLDQVDGGRTNSRQRLDRVKGTERMMADLDIDGDDRRWIRPEMNRGTKRT